MPVEKLRTAAPPDIDVLDLPFDQYQRYDAVRRIASLVGLDEKSAVLDVGGYPGLIGSFLPGYAVTITDILDCDLPNYVRTDGDSLPFPDKSFDLVCSCDVLEHVPDGLREGFLSELMRVSRGHIVITAPFYDERTKLAEEILYGYIQRVLRQDHETLREHLDNGLPAIEGVFGGLTAGGWKYTSFPSGYLYRWLPMMMVKHQFMAHGGTEEMHKRFDRLYNLEFRDSDNVSPSYRQVVFASNDAKAVSTVEDAFAGQSAGVSGAEPELFSLVARMQDTHLYRDMEIFVRHSNDILLRQIDELHEQLLSTRQQVVERDKHVENLETELNRKFTFRLWAAARKLLNR